MATNLNPTPTDPFSSMGGGWYNPTTGGWMPKQGNAQAPGAEWVDPTVSSVPGNKTAPGTASQTAQTVGPQAMSTPTPQTAGQAITGQATVGQQPQQGQAGTVAGAFQQALLNQLAPAPVSVNSPEIAPALQANRLSEQRGAERDQARLAEMAASQGWSDSGAFDAQRLGLGQERTARESAFAGNAVQQLGDRQARETLAALGLTGQMFGDQDRMALQRYGIDTDAALRREGLGAQTSLGGRELDIRDKLGSGQLNLGLLGALLNNQQFGQNLGANLGMFGANLNQQALLSLLGGL